MHMKNGMGRTIFLIKLLHMKSCHVDKFHHKIYGF
jgi:hypothetical protein